MRNFLFGASVFSLILVLVFFLGFSGCRETEAEIEAKKAEAELRKAEAERKKEEEEIERIKFAEKKKELQLRMQDYEKDFRERREKIEEDRKAAEKARADAQKIEAQRRRRQDEILAERAENDLKEEIKKIEKERDHKLEGSMAAGREEYRLLMKRLNAFMEAHKKCGYNREDVAKKKRMFDEIDQRRKDYAAERAAIINEAKKKIDKLKNP